MSKSRDIGDSAATINFIDNLTSDAQTQLNTLTTNVATNATAISNVSVTSGSQTKTYGAGETSTITLSGNVLSPIIGVTKEVAQSGVSNNDWDVNSSSENYTRYNTAAATTLDFSGFDLSTAAYNSVEFDTSGQIAAESGMAFNADGTSMYITDNSAGDVNQYNLSTAFDISTASYASTFSTSSQDTAPKGVAFNTDGTKMFICASSSNKVYTYTLTTGFDISSASYTSEYNSSATSTSPSDIVFNPDGTFMYLVNRSLARIHQYTCTTGFDLSTASYTREFDPSSRESSPEAMRFNGDGTQMYVLGEGSDNVRQYNLSTAYDISTASTPPSGGNFYVGSQENDPKGLAFDNVGGKMFVVGAVGSAVVEYNLTVTLVLGSGSFASADVGKTIEANSGVFILTSTAGAFSQTTAPTSYAQVASGSWQMYGVVFNTTDGDLELSAYINGFDIANAVHVATRAISAEGTTPEDIVFNSDGSKMFIIDSQNDRVNEYALSTAYVVSTETFTRSFSVSSQGSLPTGIDFSDDGTTMLVCDYNEQEINQYTLTTGFDVSTASFTRVLSISSIQTRPRAVALVNGGTKMYTIGDFDDEMNQWDLSTANDISSATHVGVFNTSSQATAPQGLRFSNDGTKVIVLNETVSNNVFQYDLSTAWLITSASYNGVTFGLDSTDTNPTGIAFSADGTQMFQ
jgi:sugar lactone lactonase YvrE